MTISVVDQYLTVGQTTNISIWGDGKTEQGMFFIGIFADNPGSLNIDQAVILFGNASDIYFEDIPDIAEYLNVKNPFIHIDLVDLPQFEVPLSGKLVDNITFFETGFGISTIGLFDGNGDLIDSKTICEVPEPMTLALLCLGGLFLRKFKN